MINVFKNLTKKKIAGLILILVIIIAFGFGGFGGGFNPGNQNNIAKINNTNLSTQDFMAYLNKSGLSEKVIKENIDKNILEELLSALISTTLLNLEIEDLNLVMSEEPIIERLKKNINFLDENGIFQRTLYEKFLLMNNMNAPIYELKLKNNILQKQLFTYISGGAKSPTFLVNRYYKEKNKKINIEYIDLVDFYKKESSFTDNEVKTFINENLEKLQQDYIDFSYVEITPKNLTGLDEYNQAFFDGIDEIENKISKNFDFNTIVNELNVTPIITKNYINNDFKENIENKIYNSRKNKIEILELKSSYVFYQIDTIKKKLPDLNDDEFKKQIKYLLFQKEKFEYNKKILEQINKKEFDQTDFNKFGNDFIKKIELKSIKDDDKFEINSIEILYSLPINTFTLIADDKNNVYIAKVINFEERNISKNSDEFKTISNESSAENRNTILKSYDFLLSDKYKVKINEKTLDRVKNYFR